MRSLRHLAMLPLAMLATCDHDGPVGSTLGGECRLVRTPKYAVMGKTPYDQGWINITTEAIVVGCAQPRPVARPASLDAPKAVAASKAKAKPKGWWRQHLGV